MTIHVVQTGETINTIAEQYKVSAERLILENGIINPNDLVVGQTIVIVQPLISYTIQEGDSLSEIAARYEISLIQIYRNNPFLANREYIYPGETIILSYDSEKLRSIQTSGYAYSFVNKEVLRTTLPFLTYLTIFDYRQTADGGIIEPDDQEVIDIAKEYGVAPMMLASTQTDQGDSSLEIARTLLNTPELQDYYIDNIVSVLKRKGFYGLNQYFQFYGLENQELYINYGRNLSIRLRGEGFRLEVTITPTEEVGVSGIVYENIDYSLIAQYTDALTILTYNWGVSYGPPASSTPANLIEGAITNITTTVPPEKVFLGLPVIGYIWSLPYIPGHSIANAIAPTIAIEIAVDNKVNIQYNEISQAAYYFFFMNEDQLYNVWFKDARSIEAFSNLVIQFGLQGLSIWSIMFFYTQMWFVINNLFAIERVDDLNNSNQ